MERLIGVGAALMGLYVLLNVRRFVESSARTSRDVFRVELPEGSRRAKANAIWTRTLTVVVATAMIIGGLVWALMPNWHR